MRPLHIHLSPLGGVAGDMFVAAMLNALPELRGPVEQAVRAVLPPEVDPVLEACTVSGLSALRFSVPPQQARAPVHYPDLARRIDDAGLDGATRTNAAAMLRSLAEAEALVHGVAPEAVHFHEIADWDTLADLTAAGRIIAQLEGTGWSFDPLPLGSGRIRTQHGVLAVPAPATARLLQGLAVCDDGIGGERVTPTGAAIARFLSLGPAARPRPDGVMGATGYGAGTRVLEGLANVLVAQVIETNADGRISHERISILAFEVDDMTGEEIAVAAEHLRTTAGVVDVTTTALSGKKGRPATHFRVLLRPEHETGVSDACFRQTSTLGVRLRHEDRLCLPREAGETDVDGARVRLKHAERPSGFRTTKTEADDVATAPSLAERRRIAREAEG